jgi:hypothetical protein
MRDLTSKELTKVSGAGCGPAVKVDAKVIVALPCIAVAATVQLGDLLKLKLTI